MTSPNIGAEGTLDVLVGGGSSRVWSFDVALNSWQALASAPVGVGPGGSISSLFNGCDFAFAGGGSRSFFSTGTGCDWAGVLADAPAPVVAGAALATAPGLVGAPANLVFALRGAGSSDFWQYNIAQNAWTVMPNTPAPVGDGAALVEVASCGGNSLFEIAALRGGGTSDFWCFDIAHGTWVADPGIPPVPAAVGPGASLAQSQRFGYIYALRGGGTSDFWQLKSGTWKQLADTPGPVDEGAALVAINYGTQSQRAVLFALQGGSSPAVWKYDVASDTWTHVGNIPISRSRGSIR